MPINYNADHIASDKGGYEPQRGNHFMLSLPGVDGAELIYLAIESITIPVGKSNVVVVRWGNEARKVAGNTDYEDVQMVVTDYVDTAVRDALLKWRRRVFDPTTGKVGLAKDYKVRASIVLTAPDGTSYQRTAKCIGLWPNADPTTELTMENSDKVRMTVPLTVDKVKWQGIDQL